MPTATQITVTQRDMNGARCQALFSSALQPSDAPTADMVATAISRAIQQCRPAAAGGGMTERCDRRRPAVRAAYRASRGGQFDLCAHCANQLRSALSAHDWAITPIGTYTLTPQAR